MKKLFNSFEDIFKEYKPVSTIITNESYKAHRPKTGISKDKETLIEHIILVNKYALRLINHQHIDAIVDSILMELLIEFPQKLGIGNLVKELFASTVFFHDYGKVNPNFQFEKMEETKKFSYDKTIKIDSQHSKLSVYIYVNYFIQKIDKLNNITDEERYFLYLICSVFSSIILKHHAPFIDYFINFREDEIKSIKRFLSSFSLIDCGDNFFIEEGIESLLEDCNNLRVVKNPLLVYVCQTKFFIINFC